MRNLKVSCQSFLKAHENAEELLTQQQDKRPYINVKLLCQSEMRVSIEESFPNSHIIEISDNEFEVEFSVPESEKGWFGILLGYGNKVLVLEPEKLKINGSVHLSVAQERKEQRNWRHIY